jgi:glycosyltransferase involved in cell wall biosynthesis
MLNHRFYYVFKPFIPWRVRMAGRRILARYKRKAHLDSWPIDERAAVYPPSWQGWPDRAKFSFVITHDVEGPEGLAKCRQLAELEMKLGFRSSFNFIPEGPYQVSTELRSWLTDNGFEVGVHDLNHDGKLFTTKAGFSKKAQRINHYLNEWQANGYRSGFMLRNLDWLHELSIHYDSSTFDTDPFEPQPDGVGTIFPYWIPAPESLRSQVSGSRIQPGYVELPYTLPQDSTLFLVLKEKTPGIWINKLDWIAEHGGMALVNVHPDYINFSSSPPNAKEYSSEHYAGLLRHAVKQHSERFWNPLPRTLANWFKETCTDGRNVDCAPFFNIKTAVAKPTRSQATMRGKRAAVLLYSHYPSDPRPRRAAQAMIEAGMDVDLLCLAGNKTDSIHETVAGVRVQRVTLKHRRDSKWVYFWQYGKFFALSAWYLLKMGFRHRYDVVHVHNMPDFLVFAALIPKLRGARIILDLHDPMPELMISIYGLRYDDWRVRVLCLVEKWSIRFADLVLTPNRSFKSLFISRGCDLQKIDIVMNSPQAEIFDPDQVLENPHNRDASGEFRVMHHGSILHRHGVDLLVEALAVVRQTMPNTVLDIYGHFDPFLDVVLERAKQLCVADAVRYHGSKTQSEIARAIRECHVGVVPNRRSAFTDINFPTRLFEYLSMERPVIAPDTKGIGDYFSRDQIIKFTPEDVADLASKILWVGQHPIEVQQYVLRGAQVYRKHLWREEKRHFQDRIADLLVEP